MSYQRPRTAFIAPQKNNFKVHSTLDDELFLSLCFSPLPRITYSINVSLQIWLQQNKISAENLISMILYVTLTELLRAPTKFFTFVFLLSGAGFGDVLTSRSLQFCHRNDRHQSSSSLSALKSSGTSWHSGALRDAVFSALLGAILKLCHTALTKQRAVPVHPLNPAST